MSDCKHLDFNAKVDCKRIVEEHERVMMPNGVKPQTVQVDLTINCAGCGAPLQFLGLRPGINLQGAACSPDGIEARLATVVKEPRREA
ncbi:MAG: hypothetical protein KGL39_34975 [Patescibacteria group bacterium]|nr:hypothetical protein [Patescibacteria group bacterium]